MSYEKPLVSICIPVYNSEIFLEETIMSSLDQTYQNIEIIIVDNNSNIETRRILKKFENKNKIKIFYNNKNIGMYANFNKTIEFSNGKFIKFLCSDDKLSKNCVSDMVEAMEKNPKCQIVTAKNVHIDKNNKILQSSHPLKTTGIYDGVKILKKTIRRMAGYYINTPSHVMLRNSKNLKFIDLNKNGWANDTLLWLIKLTKGDLYYIDKELVYYRRHHNSGTSKIRKNSSVQSHIDLHKAFYYYFSKYPNILNKFDLLIMKLSERKRILSDSNISCEDKKFLIKKFNLDNLIIGLFAFLFEFILIFKNSDK
jgi:glycosyltransferase involved in cell wall biosynthesis